MNAATAQQELAARLETLAHAARHTRPTEETLREIAVALNETDVWFNQVVESRPVVDEVVCGSFELHTFMA